MSLNKSEEKKKLNFSEDQNENKNKNDDNSLDSQQINNSMNSNIFENLEESQKKPLSFFETILKNKNKININYDDLDFQKGESSPRHLFRKRKADVPILNLESNSKERNSTRALREKEKDRETIFEDSGSIVGKDSSSNINMHITNNLSNCINPTNQSNPNQYINLREIHSGNISQTSNSYLQSYLNEDIKISNKIKMTYDNYLDFVHDSYFGENQSSNKEINSQNYNSTLSIDDPVQSWNNNFKFTSLDLLVNPLRQKFIWETWSPYEIALFECCVCKFNRNFDMYSRIVSKLNYI